MIMQSKLNATNRFEAINTLAKPVVTYSPNFINWNLNDINKETVGHERYQKKANIVRLYLPRTTEGMDMVQLEQTRT